jgi:hypothetical protein
VQGLIAVRAFAAPWPNAAYVINHDAKAICNKELVPAIFGGWDKFSLPSLNGKFCNCGGKAIIMAAWKTKLLLH